MSSGIRIPFRVLTLASLIVTALAMPKALVGALAVDITADLDLDPWQLGTLVGAFSLSSMLVSSRVGGGVQALGWTRSMRIGAGAASVLLVAIGFLSTNAAIFGLLLIVAGGVNAFGHPSGNLALANEVSAERHGLVFGVKHAAIPAASVLAGLSVPLVAAHVGWRGTYAFAALIPLLVLLSVPRGRRPRRPSPKVPTADIAAGTRTPRRILYVLAGASMLGVFGAHALSTFLVTYGVIIGVSQEIGGLILALGSASGIVVRVIMGWWADRTERDGIGLMVGLMLVGMLGHVLIAFGGPVLFTVGTVAAFGGGWGWTGLMTFSVVRRNRESAAAATGVSQSGVFAGAALGPAIFGFIAEALSYQAAWLLSSALLGGGAILALTFARLAPAPEAGSSVGVNIAD